MQVRTFTVGHSGPQAALLATLGALLALQTTACGNKTVNAVDAGVDGGLTCEGRSDCLTGEICAADGVDVQDGGMGFCTGCTLNGQCEAQELCGDAGLCYFRSGWGDQCTSNSQCPLGDFCVQGLCVASAQAVLCVRGNCPTGQVCNVANQVCEQNLGCTANSSCPAADICNPSTLQCEPRCDPANPGLVCAATQQCVNDRCVDCTTNADCGTGLTCDTTAGRCVAPGLCFSDQTCPAGLVCNLATHQCGAKAQPCTSDDGCPTGLVCDIVSATCVSPVCQPDQFSPNQTMSQAAPLVIGSNYSDLTLCGPTDVDWYQVQLLSGDELQVLINANVVGSGYSFDVKMVSDAGTIIADGTNLILNGTAPTTGTYYLEMTDGDPQCLYGFSTLVAHGQPCPPNPYGDIGSEADAAFIDGGIGPIYLCAGQDDWFSVDVPPGGLNVTLGCDPTQGVLAIAALQADGGVIQSSNSGLSTQTILVPDGTPNPAYLEITGDGQQNNAYTLSLAPAGNLDGANSSSRSPEPRARVDEGRDK